MTKEVGEGHAYTYIQAAIDDAGYGEMILVHDGTYMENINFKGKDITVFSENGAISTIIDGSGSRSVVTFDHGENNDSVLHGFTIQNGSANYGGGIYCYRSSPTIINCAINNNSAEYDGGGIYCGYSSPTITNCTIIGNMASNGTGIYCESYSSPTITNCTISKNIAENNWGGGICCGGDSSPTITNYILWNNLPKEISGSSLTVTYSDIQRKIGIYTGVGNINADPLFVGSESGKYYLMPGSPCIDTRTSTNAPSEDKEGIVRPQDLGIDMGAYEYVEPSSCIPRALFKANQTIGADSLTVEFDASSSGGSQYSGAVFSWDFGDGTSGSGLTGFHTYMDYGSYDVSLIITTECGSHSLTLSDFIRIKSSQVTKEVGEGHAYISIQAAIDDAGYGEMILVHDGTYMENINFKGKVITVLLENGAATTIIDGSENWSVVTFDHCEGTDSVLEGFTLQNGLEDDGGGIYCKNYSSPTITNCIITNNRAYENGGGISCRDYSSPTITNCIITDNRAEYGCGGGIYCYYTMPKIIDSLLLGNTAEGASNQICIRYDSATYNDIQILNCAEDKRIHIQRYNQFTGIWRSYYWFFEKQCGTAIPLQDDEFLYISFFP